MVKELFKAENIQVRHTTDDDLDAVIKIEMDEDNAGYIRHWSRDKHQAAITDDDIGHFIIQETGTGRIVGYIILIGLDNPDESIEFKRIAIADKGKGYGREAVRWIKKFAFEDMEAHRLWLEVMESNERAYELYRTEGFIDEGTHRESLKQGDSYNSLIVMSMLAGEYVR
jgi:diamine N-acetyltransferase